MSAATAGAATELVAGYRDPVATAAEYRDWLLRTTMTEASQATYADRAGAFARWLAGHGDEFGDVLRTERGRDYAVSRYRRHLLVERKLAPATVAGHLSAVGSLLVWHGIGKPDVPGVDLPPAAFRGLDPREQRAVLRAAEARGPRDLAIVATALLGGPRVGELAALDTDDVFISDRKGALSIRWGKGGRPRRVPIGPQCRAALSAWLDDRARRRGAGGPALFTSERGSRLAVRSIQYAVAEVGAAARVDGRPVEVHPTSCGTPSPGTGSSPEATSSPWASYSDTRACKPPGSTPNRPGRPWRTPPSSCTSTTDRRPDGAPHQDQDQDDQGQGQGAPNSSARAGGVKSGNRDRHRRIDGHAHWRAVVEATACAASLPGGIS